MRTRSLAVGALVATAALVLSACAGGGGAPAGGGVAGIDDQERGVNAINPLPRDQVQDGGDLRWPLDALPDNWNINHVDGNLLDARFILDGLLPSAFRREADATLSVDEDYFTSIELTSTDPQVVTYTINPEATWDDGTSITWTDLQAQWQAMNGTNAEYQPKETSGYDSIASIERGADDKQAVATFATPYAEWQTLYEHIHPAAVNRDPATFNTGLLADPGTTAGPFRIDTIDTTAQTVTVARNEAWWGEPAKLDRITYRAVERAALADALANNELDFYGIGSDVNLFSRAQGIQGVEIRQAVEPRYNHITINGGEGRILADPALRRAVVQGIDRQAIATALLGRISPTVQPLNNHLYLQGSADYTDNSGQVAFDPAAASAALDALGWVAAAPGEVRSKDGRQLVLQYVATAGNPISEQITQLTAAQLSAIGVGTEIVPAASADLFDQFVTPGNYDLVGFGYSASPFPISGTRDIYTSGTESNRSNISTPEIDALYAQALATLDEAARVEIGQQIDRALWDELPLLPLYQQPGAYAVRSTLANFGARGYADDRYTDIGFVAGG